VAGLGGRSLGLEVLAQLAKDELGGLVDFVTETAISVDNLDIKGNIAT
jgi:hypothetical protein